MQHELNCSKGHTWTVEVTEGATNPDADLSCPICNAPAMTLLGETPAAKKPESPADPAEGKPVPRRKRADLPVSELEISFLPPAAPSKPAGRAPSLEQTSFDIGGVSGKPMLAPGNEPTIMPVPETDRPASPRPGLVNTSIDIPPLEEQIGSPGLEPTLMPEPKKGTSTRPPPGLEVSQFDVPPEMSRTSPMVETGSRPPPDLEASLFEVPPGLSLTTPAAPAGPKAPPDLEASLFELPPAMSRTTPAALTGPPAKPVGLQKADFDVPPANDPTARASELGGGRPTDEGSATEATLPPLSPEESQQHLTLGDPGAKPVSELLEESSRGQASEATGQPGARPTQSAKRIITSPIPGYEILSELGRGGMGVVYKARHLQLGRIVALKMILGGMHAGGEYRRRFLIEAEAIARLKHPNIVHIYEYGEKDGNAFFTLELLEGGSLQSKTGSNLLGFREAASIIEKIARAMDYAHGEGLIHRDLKPANILLTKEGDPKVTDFGLVKKFEEESGQTGTGAVMGTPSYMPPEQAQGKKDVGPPADIYATGAMLYDLLTGRPPFRGETVLDTLQMVQSAEPVPPAHLQPKVPLDLQTICLKCLEKDPGKRYATAGALADDLQRYLNNEPIQARPTPALERAMKWCRRRPAVAALVGVCSLLALALMIGGPLWAGYEQSLRSTADREKDNAVTQEKLAEKRRGEAETNFKLAEFRRKETDKERQRAEENFKHARDAVDQMLTRVGREKLVHEPRMEKVRRDLLLKALAFYERFLQEETTDPGLRFETAAAQQRVAEIQEMLGAYDAAAKASLAAIELYKGLLTEFPGRPEYLKELGGSYTSLSVTLQTLNRNKEAEGASQEALAILAKLSNAVPGEPKHQLQLGKILYDRGNYLQTRKRPAEAEKAYNQAVAIFVKLTSDNPAEPTYQFDYGRTLRNLAVLLTTTRPVDAEPVYRQAADVLTKLVTKHPNVADYPKELGGVYANLGVALQITNRPGEAERVYRQSIDFFAKLAEQYPSVPDYRFEQAAGSKNLAVLLKYLNRAKEGETTWHEARIVLKKLADDLPLVPLYRQELARNYQELGVHYAISKRIPEAEQAWTEALDLQKKLVADHPDNPEYRLEMARTHGDLGILLTRSQRYEGSKQHFSLAISLLEELAIRYPALPVYADELLKVYVNQAQLLSALGFPNTLEAEKSWAAAAGFLKKQVTANPKAPEPRNSFAAANVNLAALLLQRNRTAEAQKVLKDALRVQREAMLLPGITPAVRQAQCTNLLSIAQVLVAAKDHAEAAKVVGELVPLAPPVWNEHARAATVLALCVTVVKNDTAVPEAKRTELGRDYANQSMTLLKQAVSRGFRDVDSLRKGEPFEPLRNRDDFRMLVGDLETRLKATDGKR